MIIVDGLLRRPIRGAAGTRPDAGTRRDSEIHPDTDARRLVGDTSSQKPLGLNEPVQTEVATRHTALRGWSGACVSARRAD
jgi:hypothetical protein